MTARPRQGPDPRTHCFYAEIPGAKIRFLNAFNAMKFACDVGASEAAIAAHRTEVITLRDEYNFLCAREILCDLYQKARSPFHFLNRPLTNGDIKSFDAELNNQLREVDGEPDLVFRDDRWKSSRPQIHGTNLDPKKFPEKSSSTSPAQLTIQATPNPIPTQARRSQPTQKATWRSTKRSKRRVRLSSMKYSQYEID